MKKIEILEKRKSLENHETDKKVTYKKPIITGSSPKAPQFPRHLVLGTR